MFRDGGGRVRREAEVRAVVRTVALRAGRRGVLPARVSAGGLREGPLRGRGTSSPKE